MTHAIIYYIRPRDSRDDRPKQRREKKEKPAKTVDTIANKNPVMMLNELFSGDKAPIYKVNVFDQDFTLMIKSIKSIGSWFLSILKL